MLKRLEDIVSLFMRITTGIVFVTAVYIQMFWGQETELEVKILWQILIVSGVCAAGGIILPYKEEKVSKQSSWFRMVLYYVFVNIVVLFCAFSFGWCKSSDWKQILGMIVAILGVFLVVAVVSYWADYQAAEKINQKLRERGQ